MIDIEYIRIMSSYGKWQNTSILEAAGALDETARHQHRGAFFGSIQGTLNHLLWGDRLWMHRFAGTEKPSMASIPESVGETDCWNSYRTARVAMDATICTWAETLDSAWLQGNLEWFSGAVKRSVSKPRQLLVVHFFNHGTHHRGQVHSMLTSAGVTLDDTDIPFMPERS